MNIKQILEKYNKGGRVVCPKTVPMTSPDGSPEDCMEDCNVCIANEIKESLFAELEKLDVIDGTVADTLFTLGKAEYSKRLPKSMNVYEKESSGLLKVTQFQLQHDKEKIKEIFYHECEICGKKEATEYCTCDGCREAINADSLLSGDKLPDEPLGRWLCKDCMNI